MDNANLRTLKRPQLIELAGRYKIKKRHRMRKRELVKRLQKLVPGPELDKLVRRIIEKDGRTVTRAQASSRRPQAPSPPTPSETFVDRGTPLPANYGQDRLTALVRDPNCVYIYWELDGPRCSEIRTEHGDAVFHGASWILRAHSDGDGYPRDIPVVPEAGNWYLSVPDDRSFVVELGIVTRRGDFVCVAASNSVRTPRVGMSDDTSAEWMLVEDDFRTVQRLGVDEAPEVGDEFAEALAERFRVPGMSSLFLGASERVPGSHHMGSHTLQRRHDRN